MASKEDIANLSLVSLLGCNKITSLDDEQTEAIVMKASYDHCRDTVLEDRAWTFSTKRDVWIPTADAPAFDYSYSYQIPSKVLRVISVDDGRNSASFMWAREGDRILTDASSINVRYLERIENPSEFTSGFINALSIYLAWFNCTALTEASANFKADLWQRYETALTEAGKNDGQQGRREQTRNNELLRGR